MDDGNGRMSRLLTLLLLYKAGYMVGKCTAIDKEIERAKGGYYDAPYACRIRHASLFASEP